MRIAVIADIHANLPALRAVLDEVDAEEPDALWCLGDVVGYGPRPNECCAVVRERADLCLVGNHDLAALGELDVADFSPDAAAAARWTSEELDDDSRAFLRSLEPRARAEDVELFHASARHPVWEYVLTPEAALATLTLVESPLVLVGHSHVALALSLEEGRIGGDRRASWLLLDLERRFAEFRRAPYPVQQTQVEMRERGLPEALATRLAHGH